MKPDLYIFCGAPGCGKTTLAKMLAKKIGNAFHIQTDVVRQMLAYKTYLRSESSFIYHSCIMLAEEALKNGYNVILDGTFSRDEYRQEAIERLKEFYDKYRLIYVKCYFDVASIRNSKRTMRVPSQRLVNMHMHFEQPVNALVIDTTELKPNCAFNILIRELSKHNFM